MTVPTEGDICAFKLSKEEERKFVLVSHDTTVEFRHRDNQRVVHSSRNICTMENNTLLSRGMKFGPWGKGSKSRECEDASKVNHGQGTAKS